MNPLDLHAYADNQLTAEERNRVKSEIEANPAAKAELAAIVSLKGMVAERCEVQTCEVTWKRCVGRLDEIDKARKVESFVGRYSWALCGLVALAIVGGGVFNRGSSAVASGDVARYASLLQSSPASTSGLSPQTQAFREAIEAGLTRQQSEDRPTILSATEVVRDGRTMMMLRLADPQGSLTLMSLPGAKLGEGMEPIPGTRFHAGMMGAVNCVAWETSGSLRVVAGNRPYAELVKVADKYCCQAK